MGNEPTPFETVISDPDFDVEFCVANSDAGSSVGDPNQWTK